ncbi:hypothetical protein ACJX0J_022586, partial [Zea mays]
PNAQVLFNGSIHTLHDRTTTHNFTLAYKGLFTIDESDNAFENESTFIILNKYIYKINVILICLINHSILDDHINIFLIVEIEYFLGTPIIYLIYLFNNKYTRKIDLLNMIDSIEYFSINSSLENIMSNNKQAEQNIHDMVQRNARIFKNNYYTTNIRE